MEEGLRLAKLKNNFFTCIGIHPIRIFVNFNNKFVNFNRDKHFRTTLSNSIK